MIETIVQPCCGQPDQGDKKQIKSSASIRDGCCCRGEGKVVNGERFGESYGYASDVWRIALDTDELAFAAGHLLAVVAPVATVLGAPHLMAWAQLLASPDGVDRLIKALAAAEEPPATGVGERHA